MITEQDLLSAIKACEGDRNPNASTAMKLAAYYTIQDRLYGSGVSAPIDRGYSNAAPPDSGNGTIDYSSDTEFGAAVSGKPVDGVFGIMDDLMLILSTSQPRVFRRVIADIQDL